MKNTQLISLATLLLCATVSLAKPPKKPKDPPVTPPTGDGLILKETIKSGYGDYTGTATLGGIYTQTLDHIGPTHLHFKKDSYTGPLSEAAYGDGHHVDLFTAGIFQETYETDIAYDVTALSAGPVGGVENAALFPTGMGQVKADALGKLFGLYSAEAVAPKSGDSTDQTAAFQAAVWEIIHETSGTYGLGDGEFQIAGTGDWMDLADHYLSTFEQATIAGELMLLSNETYQDYIVMGGQVAVEAPSAPAVPEPITLASLGLCFLGAGGSLRRRLT